MSLKPMNCPSHHLYYASETHSYRELPIRYATLDVLHRNELSGALSGLTRVRQFAQDDCHVYLREDQIAEEVGFLMDFILGHYDAFGLTSRLKFATRPEQRIGSDEQWDEAEAALRAALDRTGRDYDVEALAEWGLSSAARPMLACAAGKSRRSSWARLRSIHAARKSGAISTARFSICSACP
jgi:threonyl-tRNA synthetase